MSAALRPLFVTVTWGAGGSTFGRSMELAEVCQRQLGLTTCLHLTCTNTNKKLVDNALREAKEIGIRNILALRGDPPRDEEYEIDGNTGPDGPAFTWAVDLVRYIREQYGDYFCIGVAGYPEGHADESHPIDQDPRHDIPFLVEKVKAGADFIMTQLFYDTEAYLDYVKLVTDWDNGVLRNTILIPGLMPIQRYQNFKRVAQLSHAKIPPELVQRLEPIKGNDDEVKSVGVKILSDIIQRIRSAPSPTTQGFHFFTLNLEKVVSLILEKNNLIAPETNQNGNAIDDSETTSLSRALFSGSASVGRRSHRRSSAHNHINDENSSTGTMEAPTRAAMIEITHGVGSLGREATWDDYPNGRFGDARSPAFGEIDGYGPSLHLSTTAARTKWGYPVSRADLGQLFLSHIRGDLDQLPWSEGPLSPETRSIERQLSELISAKGWLSIASQPAVDGKKSSDPVYGWGPRGGFVFQKAFVEFWIPADDWHKRLLPRLQAEDIAEQVSWYVSARPVRSPPGAGADAAAGKGSNTLAPPAAQNGLTDGHTRPDQPQRTSSAHYQHYAASSGDAQVNSVTWGVFPGKEIVTPTMVEEISFRAWAEEAYGIWGEWERCYFAGNPSRDFLNRCKDEYLLVNVIGHAFREENALWEILMSA